MYEPAYLKQHVVKCGAKAENITDDMLYIWKLIAPASQRSKEDLLKSRSFMDILYYVATAKERNLRFIPEYAKWCIGNHLKVTTWFNMDHYNTFLKMYILRENPNIAVERTLDFIYNSGKCGEYFEKEPVAIILTAIEVGDISPWIIFVYPDIEVFFNRFTDAHLELFNKLINMDLWAMRLGKMQKTVSHLTELLKDVTL